MVETQVGRRLSLGLGAEYYGTRNFHGNDRSFLNSVPVYANARLSSTGWGTKLFIEGRAGYAFPIGSANIDGTTYSTQGLFTGAGIGINFYGNSISIGLNAIDVNNGYQLLDNDHTGSDIVTDVYLRYSYSFPVN